ncbi:MAG: DNA-processing protein DprA [Lachnospiraceae bacterium]|nr:DNA-processing protein DprA [Lachnospiraceae bacterium]
MENSDREKIYACWLDSIRFLTSANKYRLLEAAGTAYDIYNMKENDTTFWIGAKGSALFQEAKAQDPEKLYENLQKMNIKYTFCNADDFPARFRKIPDPPFGLFYRGALPEDQTPSVAIIGARKCSEYGHCMAKRFAEGLGRRGVNIISGMALGIDGISQRAALDIGARSYAVLGCGADVVYPKSNQPLYERLLKDGGILSEYPIGTEPRPMLFPPRNRIISALSDVVLVVEAREKSGTLITVDMALEQGREVYVVPGRCTENLSVGCNMLLRQGASAALCAEDIINDMGWSRLLPEACEDKTEGVSSYINTSELSKLSKAVCEIVDILPVTQDTIIMLLREKGFQETVAEICNTLVELELNGVIVRAGGQYRRNFQKK